MFPHSNKQEEIGAGAFERRLLLFIYRRVSDEYLDPLAFEPSSLLGVPNLMQAYKKGNVALINALGNGVTDDKGIYYFVPKMIKYYLHEEPILHNAPTYLPYYPEDYDYILSHLEKLVIKDVSEAGGYGVMFGRDLTPERLAELKALIVAQPRRWIAQEVIDFKDIEEAYESLKHCSEVEDGIFDAIILQRLDELVQEELYTARDADYKNRLLKYLNHLVLL